MRAEKEKRPCTSTDSPLSDSSAETPKQRQLVTDQPSPRSRWPRNARGRTRKARGNPAPNGTAAFRSESWPISRVQTNLTAQRANYQRGVFAASGQCPSVPLRANLSEARERRAE